MSMTVGETLTRAQQATVRAHLQTLRRSLAQARDELMHFKDDRLDRDKLEPAARRADDLMDMFAGDLRDAQVDITALLDMIGPARQLSAAAAVSTGPAG